MLLLYDISLHHESLIQTLMTSARNRALNLILNLLALALKLPFIQKRSLKTSTYL
jgi:hypothetical protein